MKVLTTIIPFLVLTFSAVLNVNAYTIDSFDLSAGPLTTSGLSEEITNSPTIFTTQRDFAVFSNTGGGTTTAVVTDGKLNSAFTSSAGGGITSGQVVLDYDGDESLFDCSGVPCSPTSILTATGGDGRVYDLTDDGASNAIRLRFSEFKGPFTLFLDWGFFDFEPTLNTEFIFSSFNDPRTLSYMFEGFSNTPTDFFIPFSDITNQYFVSGLNLDKVGMLKFTFLMQLESSFSLEGIDTTTYPVSVIPLPGAIWFFGTALVGLIGFSKRRKAG